MNRAGSIRPAAEDKLINYDELSKEFTGYYREFDAALKRSPFRDVCHTGLNCYAFLGVSGAGKTTTLARLSSNLENDEFHRKVCDWSGNNSEVVNLVESVTIGHPVNSTTVVPKLYSIPGLHICDMPGFAETCSQMEKKITINILQKCFMTKEIPMTIVDAYHQPLLDPLGDKYYNAIDVNYRACKRFRRNDGAIIISDVEPTSEADCSQIEADCSQIEQLDVLKPRKRRSDLFQKHSIDEDFPVKEVLVTQKTLFFEGSLAKVIKEAKIKLAKLRQDVGVFMAALTSDPSFMKSVEDFKKTLDICGEIKSKEAESALVAMVNELWEAILEKTTVAQSTEGTSDMSFADSFYDADDESIGEET